MPSEAERFFEGAAELGRIIAEQRKVERQEQRDARNARRRARYAVTKAYRRVKPAGTEQPADEDEFEPGCRCHAVAMPPCSFCENLTEEEWETLEAAS